MFEFLQQTHVVDESDAFVELAIELFQGNLTFPIIVQVQDEPGTGILIMINEATELCCVFIDHLYV